ncbi:alpha-galactosidase [Nakamurella sp. UYEF19]|uniref:alpha-galactosidase n=1 Tax=Nakamurella sp. UYEF19 TaxID=1756392 RepID=UPI00339AEBAD
MLDCTGDRLPRILHWGQDLGDLDARDLDALRQAFVPPVVTDSMDLPVPLSVLAEPSAGWAGTPGLAGHRSGCGFAPLFTVLQVVVDDQGAAGGQQVLITATEPDVELDLLIEILLTAEGLLMLRTELTNRSPEGTYELEGLTLNVPVPTEAREVLDFSGRHLRERSPQRHAFTIGTHTREGRRGRTGADASILLAVGTPGFGFRSGQVWAVHTAWSGNHRTTAERTPRGVGLLSGAELLLPGEIRLAPQESYRTPWLYAAHGFGLDSVSARFHGHLRARPDHPSGPRKVVLNTWEAAYFDHDLNKLKALADRAAEVGVERFVLDDGWFRHRRGVSAGLGDWFVDETIWPDGLSPLVDHVRAVGLDFGLWVEPEMISVDSDVARAHPEWIMSAGHRLPPESRHQQVLDLANPDAYDYILGRLDALVSEYRIDYLKWDHNRDLVDAGHPLTGTAGVHHQTLATYQLMEQLHRRHPSLEIESCSPGGARIDLAILQCTQRVWASDCNDALERQHIQRWTSLLVPPELIGSHIGPTTAHTTGRIHPLGFRAGTALFGHLGVEWDLTAADEPSRAELKAWIRIYRTFRSLLHTGTVVRSDHPDPSLWVHGVIAKDGTEALFAFVSIATGEYTSPGLVRLPGLDPTARYRLQPLEPPGTVADQGLKFWPPWWSGGVESTGRTLSDHGVQAPSIPPESLVLLHAQRINHSTHG